MRYIEILSRKHIMSYCEVVSIVLSAIVASIGLMSPTHAANPEKDRINITVPVSCTMDGSGMNSHNANIDNHDYETEIGTTTIVAYCNDINGFSIYAIGYSNETYGNTDLIGQNSDELIPTGTTLDGTASNWAMKLSTDPNATYPISIQNSYNNYKAVPSSYTLVAKRESATDVGSAAIGSTLTTTYAASVSPTQHADTYIGKVRYTLVHPYTETAVGAQPAAPGKIVYYPNASNVVGTMGEQTASDNASLTLLASNFSRQGYGFAGWSITTDYSDPNGFYGPQEVITTPSDVTTKGLSLYAHWIESAGSLQGFTCPNNTNMPIGTVTALTDLRDNETYAVAKLADGNCWMIENLRLESTNSDNATGYLAQGYGESTIYGNFSGLANAETSRFSNSTVANSLYYSSTQGDTATINIGTTNYPGFRMPRYNNYNHKSNSQDRPQNPATNSATNSTTKAGMYSYGNYYTWHAAVADLTYNGTKNSSVVGTSLCPTGWHLPIAGGKDNTGLSEFWIVSRAIIGADPANFADDAFYYTGSTEGANASKKMRKYPNNYLFSGYYNSTSIADKGNSGSYWASTVYDDYYSYGLGIGGSVLRPGTSSTNKYAGRSIRCLISS